MMFVDETKKAIDIIMLKDKNPKAMGVAEALVFYYKASLIPLILTAIVAAIMGTVAGGTLVTLVGLFSHSAILSGLFGLLSAGLAVLAIIFVIILFWIIIPIGFLIDAIIYHIFGKLLRQFKQGYNVTLSAMVYASMVSVVLFFLFGIPILGAIVGLIAGIWGLVSIIVWIARFQKISWVMSLVVLIVTWIVLGIIIFVIFLGAFFELGVFGGSTLPTACVAQSGFICSNPIWSGSNIAVIVGQSSGQTYTPVAIAFLNATDLASFQINQSFPAGTSISSSADGIGTMASGVTYPVNLPSGVMNPTINQGISGQVWLEYTMPGSSADQFVEVATLTAMYT